MRKLLMVIAVFMLIPGVASAGGGGGEIPQCPGFATGTTVSMLDSCFSGIAHFAPTEATITISNDGELPHTFTAVDGSFDSGQVQAGESFELVIDEPGVFEVFCKLHGTAQGQGMAGVLVVGEAQPLPVSAQIDVDAIKQAVTEKDGPIIGAIERQSQLIDTLVTDQALLIQGLEDGTYVSEANLTAAPTVVTLPGESSPGSTWAALAAGLGLGLSVAALIAIRPALRRQERASELDVLQPST